MIKDLIISSALKLFKSDYHAIAAHYRHYYADNMHSSVALILRVKKTLE